MSRPFDLSGRRALVTGAGSPSGIGFATARMLGEAGARVIVSATTPRIHERAAELTAIGIDAVGVIADLTEPSQAAALVAAADDALGGLDILVNNAGMVQSGVDLIEGRFADQPADHWRRQIELTLFTAVNTTRAALPALRASGRGRIVMISSVTGPVVTADGSSAYAAAKGAMDGLMRTVALEEGPAGITCNSVAPGWIHTGSSSEAEIRAGAATPVGRPARPEEVAAAAVFLATDESSYVTGTTIIVDGGNTIQEYKG